MEAHGSCDSTALGSRRSDVAAVRDVRAAALLIRLQVVGPEHSAILFPHKRHFFGGRPVFERLLFGHVARKRVGIAAADHWLEDCPNGFSIKVAGWTDGHALSLRESEPPICLIGSKEAKDFLVEQASQQAAIQGVRLSDLGKRMMYFTGATPLRARPN